MLVCPDSLLVIHGIRGKAQKWRHDWQGLVGPVSQADLWTQLLAETGSQGTAVHWLHNPSHIGIEWNEKADLLADMGRRTSPLLKGYVTMSRAIMDSGIESDIEEKLLWTGPERVGDHGTPLLVEPYTRRVLT
jgi:hypothetical protein